VAISRGFAFAFEFGFVLEFVFEFTGARPSPASGEGREALDVVGSCGQEKYKTSHPSNFEVHAELQINFKSTAGNYRAAIVAWAVSLIAGVRDHKGRATRPAKFHLSGYPAYQALAATVVHFEQRSC
jgi:hypothetical protein